MFREKSMPKDFWRVVEGCTKFTFPQREECSPLMMNEASIGFAKARGR